MSDTSHPAKAYIAYYESLKVSSLDDLASVVHEDVTFKDPFNDVRGVEAYKAVLGHMFNAAPDIKFTVLHCAYDGDACFLRWDSRATVKALGQDPWVVQGMSELRFAPDGRVLSHIDYWDSAAQFYERVPVLGSILRFIRRRAAGG